MIIDYVLNRCPDVSNIFTIPEKVHVGFILKPTEKTQGRLSRTVRGYEMIIMETSMKELNMKIPQRRKEKQICFLTNCCP